MTDQAIDYVRQVEAFSGSELAQINIPVEHFLHEGMYARSIKIPKGVMLTGALIKIPTILVVSGHTMIYTDGGWVEKAGYNVLSAAAHRKQIFLAIEDTDLTMFFPTTAKSVREAEEHFTDEFYLLQSRRGGCQAE